MEQAVNTLILGVGNPIVTDDGAGIKIARKIRELNPDLEVMETSDAGLALLDLIVGYERLLIIDSIKTMQGEPGELYKLGMEDLKPCMDLSSSHGLDLATVFEIGKRMGYEMPRSVRIYALEITDNTTFGEECTKEVEESIPTAVRKIIEEERL